MNALEGCGGGAEGRGAAGKGCGAEGAGAAEAAAFLSVLEDEDGVEGDTPIGAALLPPVEEPEEEEDAGVFAAPSAPDAVAALPEAEGAGCAALSATMGDANKGAGGGRVGSDDGDPAAKAEAHTSAPHNGRTAPTARVTLKKVTVKSENRIIRSNTRILFANRVNPLILLFSKRWQEVNSESL